MAASVVEHAPPRRMPPSSRPAFAGCVLTRRELDALKQLARGLSYAQAARELGCSTSTVRSLLHTAYKRLGVSTIVQALAVCTDVGWLDFVPNDGEVVELADRRVTWAQRLYLEAFDQALRAGDDAAEIERTRVLRDAAVTGMFKEVDKERPWRAMANDPLERIARTLRRLDARADGLPTVDRARTGPWDGGERLVAVDA
jgi:DNA-binding CsgD family transcriptional regulator